MSQHAVLRMHTVVRYLAVAAVVVILFGGLAAGGWLPAVRASPSSLVLAPSADAFVDAGQPDLARGHEAHLRTSQSPDQRLFLRFEVAGAGLQTVTRATLRLYANGSSPAGYAIHGVDGAWSEASLTYANQPALGAALAQSGAHGGARYTEVDLTSLVTGDGTYDLALVALADKPVSYPSREASANRPELVLELGGAATAAAPIPTQQPPPPATLEPTAAPGSLQPGGTLSLCGLKNSAWTDTGRLLRGGAPSSAATLQCLAQFGVDAIIDQRMPSEDWLGEQALAEAAGIEYLNLGVPDDTAPSPERLLEWIDAVESRLAQGQLVLVHDRAGRGRMGLWDAVYWLRHGLSAQSAIEDRYLARALDFAGAKIGCGDGGNGQVQALNEIGLAITGQSYWPQSDEFGTAWANCPRPGYMDGWSYAGLAP